MKLDRKLQLAILQRLANSYPDSCAKDKLDSDHPLFRANVSYLFEHGLIKQKEYRDEKMTEPFAIAITAAGMDFLADDGGLTAILGTLTVKLHDETIRHLLEARIEASDLPEEDKKGWQEKLRELRGESIKHLTMKLLDKGAESLPAILDAIQTSL